mmetsp:Transcript_16052/g.29420  ORF Transcript_16052/g.29420 Transcript_16052/m.29420 type:complete len:112 (-) Transcript_16052:1166-1501(-)|eukprot:CAMPEP_0204907768 /NCGR_PEP_ID=MMETSP1397-20131031/6834_1 /ASSEMBLY_ACC=CAM_ASM_000891 /TAXON_ID=49980 /ORGANISM="Climacostomum Climacostomum virens, Strain Stock W-24" /LENGTH=111 /DNA_ID=CAMNT_0052077023 /DNA_START=151 /DNA_END=486 /DNA_ORIENTATION=+
MELTQQRTLYSNLNAILTDQIILLEAEQRGFKARRRLLTRKLLQVHKEVIRDTCELLQEEISTFELGAYDFDMPIYAELASDVVEKKLAGYIKLLKLLELMGPVKTEQQAP